MVSVIATHSIASIMTSITLFLSENVEVIEPSDNTICLTLYEV